jgi:hypothetical protein
LTAALIAENDRVVGNIDGIAGSVQIDHLPAGHNPAQRDDAGFCACTAEGAAAARQSRQLHGAKRSNRQASG